MILYTNYPRYDQSQKGGRFPTSQAICTQYYRWHHGGQHPLKDSEKGKWRNMWYFRETKLLKLASLSSLSRKYIFCKGFYENFITKKKMLASVGFVPDSHQGALPSDGTASWTSEVALSPTPNNLLWCRPSTILLHSHFPHQWTMHSLL